MPIEYRISWESRLFVLYVLTVLLIVLGKALSLAWQLWWFSAKKMTSLRNPGQVIDVHSLVALALANRLSCDVSPRSWNIPANHFPAGITLPVLQQAERRFRYAWETRWSNVGFLRRLVVLTLLCSFLMLGYGTMTTLMLASSPSLRSAGVLALSGNIAEAVAFFLAGNLTCVVIYAVSSLCEGALTRRRVLWDYFCATIKEQAKGKGAE